MIEYKVGDILQEDAEAIVNSVNCVGVMGRGVALQFKKAYPDNFESYVEACSKKEIVPGKMHVYETGRLSPRYIINFPTKRHWRNSSRIEDIKEGLQDLARVVREHDIRSIAIPPLGSGLGGLDWREVKALVQATLDALPGVRAIVFEPRDAENPIAIPKDSPAPKMTRTPAIVVELIRRYIAGLLDPFITLLELHKLLYLMQEKKEPLKLQYTKGPYGPYAENLRHVLHRIEGHFIEGYADGGDEPAKRLEIVPGVEELAVKKLNESEETKKRFDDVSDLVDGFESPFGLELLTTVHWVATRDAPDSPEKLIQQVYNWNDRKRQFSERQITIARERFISKGWIAAN